MVNIPDFTVDPQRERRAMEDQARQAIQDLNDFILGGASAYITRLSVSMFQASLVRYERDFEAKPSEGTREQRLLEKLAERAHASWSHWMQYLFSKSCKQADGSVVIPASMVERWERQMNTPYSQLSEQEKQSDRDQAELSLPIIYKSVNG